jgi:hypothetical protein
LIPGPAHEDLLRSLQVDLDEPPESTVIRRDLLRQQFLQ